MPKGIFPRKSIDERFWEKVLICGEDECWPWLAGMFYDITNSRVAYILKVGPLKSTDLACHTCNNKRCCNPKHLYKGNRLSNAQDAVIAGNYNFGEYNGNAKLSDENIKAIKRLLTSDLTQKEIGAV